jgi:hypothetical protein
VLLRTLSVVLAFTTAAFAVLFLRAQNHQASQSDAENTHSRSSAMPLILQENDGEHRIRRPGGPTGSGSVSEFIIKHYCPAKISGGRSNSLTISTIAHGRNRNDLDWKRAGLSSFRLSTG